ncbi:MAG: biotin/lipoyl-binding carrier protein [Actinobacteria bacterium]|jgi:biotin carboxyl carrier protein|nr:biotin/lipoyl-binding carrier protein [Actinomycetota bacterium]
MVANILEVSVSLREQVSTGDVLLLLESMKMEIPVLAEVTGSVVEIAVSKGDVVQEGDPLVMIDTSLAPKREDQAQRSPKS